MDNVILNSPDGEVIVASVDEIKEVYFENKDFSFWITQESALALRDFLNKAL